MEFNASTESKRNSDRTQSRQTLCLGHCNAFQSNFVPPKSVFDFFSFVISYPLIPQFVCSSVSVWVWCEITRTIVRHVEHFIQFTLDIWLLWISIENWITTICYWRINEAECAQLKLTWQPNAKCSLLLNNWTEHYRHDVRFINAINAPMMWHFFVICFRRWLTG